mmetsp:Transcript_23714/g.32660  ORF Transcript_23714/g.32660 Transcript_23714/m.32660 type:complete len:119 (+) Transcript_23714:76-432(+)|eukprot:CAMPEP_0196583320 /NCGR_PEP_ID=MMETSP1081-20130531/42983_1 /TAXON_ID=36882 /ORGANISM="Pyramimonas amylifera, Strain CCMP720" /LENGTH=118 /DNA_ID=CAMNT_0041904161 /DNA_START=76 /DNA_END=432 /DNA_ORIENTATION=+
MAALLNTATFGRVNELRASSSVRFNVPSKMSTVMKADTTGRIVSSKCANTVVVLVETQRPHPKYKKMVNISKKFHAYDESNELVEGQFVRIEPSGRRLSKMKRWVVAEICGDRACDAQ